MSARRLGAISVVVRDYDEAIAWYTRCLGFVLIEDSARGEGKRWVVVAAAEDSQTALLLAAAASEGQSARVGDQTGGRVFLLLYTDDFERDHARMLGEGVKFLEQPRHESYGSVAVFEDLYGNKWDLLQLAPAG